MSEFPPREAGRGNDRRLKTGESALRSHAGYRDIGMYGLCVRTSIDLPSWPDPPQREPQVLIHEEPPSAATFTGAHYDSRSSFVDGEVQVEVRGVGRFTASRGSCIRVAPESGARPEDVRLYLTGAMFGVVLHQRGIFPLHASCVAIEGKGVAFAGPSGIGKSTLVAALLERGATFVTDDICALTPVRDGESRVWPGATRIKLDGAGMAAVDRAHTDLESAGGDRGKYHLPVSAGTTQSTAVPLSRVYLLGFDDGHARLDPLRGLDAISALVDETYVLPCAVALGLSPQIFKSVAQLSRTLTVSRLIRPRGFAHLDAVLELIERDVRGVRGQVSHAARSH